MPCRTRCGSTCPTCRWARGSSTPSWPTTPSPATRPARARAARPPRPGRVRAAPTDRRRDMSTPMVLVEDLHVAYGRRPALAGVDLRVEAATIVGVLGHNGAGKTTLIRVLTTLVRPSAGRAVVA